MSLLAADMVIDALEELSILAYGDMGRARLNKRLGPSPRVAAK